MLQPLRLSDPVCWLRSGWRDLLAAHGIALFYGICFWLMAVVLGAVFRNLPQHTRSFVSGCFLVGPFLAMGLYEASRRREQSLPQSLGASLTCRDKHLGSMGMLVGMPTGAASSGKHPSPSHLLDGHPSPGLKAIPQRSLFN